MMTAKERLAKMREENAADENDAKTHGSLVLNRPHNDGALISTQRESSTLPAEEYDSFVEPILMDPESQYAQDVLGKILQDIEPIRNLVRESFAQHMALDQAINDEARDLESLLPSTTAVSRVVAIMRRRGAAAIDKRLLDAIDQFYGVELPHKNFDNEGIEPSSLLATLLGSRSQERK